ncbi:MAG: 3'(2'),5'-bisphosphate nucleotidase [Anaerolineae bacterium]|nr:3'(2'),5'-bisphosphate nucleotidase [Anaerolineae bacterium]
MAYNREKRVAVAAVMQAARLCRMVRADLVVDSLQKDDRSPVTVADFGSQALACWQLKKTFPNDVIVAEEDSGDLRVHADKLAQVVHYVQQFHPGVTSETVCAWIDAGNGAVTGRYWTLDPIDGTKGFLRNDQYAVALALVENGEVKVAVLACPALPLRLDAPDSDIGTLFVAVRDEGAAMAPLDGTMFTPIHVATEAGNKPSRFVESVESAHGDHARQEAVAQTVGFNQPSLRMDSQAKYGAVARGDAALYLRLPSPTSPDYREKIWDHAAGTLIVAEAGGRVTDMHGQPLDFASGNKMKNNRGVVVSNGIVHAAVIETLKRSFIVV